MRVGAKVKNGTKVDKLMSEREMMYVENTFYRERKESKKYERTHLGYYIRYRRLRKGLTLRDVEKRCKVHGGSLQNIEKGRSRKFTVQTLMKLYHCLELDWDDVMKAIELDNA